MTTSRGFAWLYAGALGLTLVLVLFAFWLGKFPVSTGDVLAALAAKLFGVSVTLPVNTDAVIWQIRAPRIAAALLVGAGLAAAGSSYQSMFKNPLVSPDILGVSSGAALGAVLGIFLSKNIVMIQFFAFMGGLAAVGLVYAISSSVRGHDALLTLILTGVVIGTLLGSFIALLKYLADPYNQLPAITFWLMGSLAAIAPSDLMVAAPLIALGLAPLYLLRWRINLLSLSDDEARALGVNATGMRFIVIVAATLMTAASVAISGIIGWIGLLMPHIARMLVGPDFAKAMPMSLLLGAAFMLGVDTLARTAANIEIPPGVLTALIGTPFFVWILATARRGWH
ncbi:MAG TPA: iron ABC transporter permease [Burkholderiales bacterium]|nr:iron ABC transporter permease [Burkholderiales bacterium]